jgi:hypothetical protein
VAARSAESILGLLNAKKVHRLKRELSNNHNCVSVRHFYLMHANKVHLLSHVEEYIFTQKWTEYSADNKIIFVKLNVSVLKLHISQFRLNHMVRQQIQQRIKDVQNRIRLCMKGPGIL